LNCVVGGITNAPFSSTSQASSASESGFTSTGIAPTRSKPTAHRWRTSVPSIRTCGVSQVQGPRSLEVLEAVTDGPMPEHFNYMAEVLICRVTTSFPVVADCATTMAIALPASFVALRRRPLSGVADWEDFNPAVQSWIGHARHAETEGLRRVIFGGTIFCRRSRAEAEPVPSRWFAEQQTEEGACGKPQQQHRISSCPG